MLSKKRLSTLLGATISALTLVGALLFLLSAPGLARAADIPVFDFVKTIDKASVSAGDIFTVTLAINPSAALTQTMSFTATDPFDSTGRWEVLPGTIVQPTGGVAYYEPAYNGVVWTGDAVPGVNDQVTFQVRVKNASGITAPTVVTNVAFMNADAFGSLPTGSLPGSLNVPGSLPPADGARVAWANVTLLPGAVSVFPVADGGTTPYALKVYTLTISNNSPATDTIALSYSASTVSQMTSTVHLPMGPGMDKLLNWTANVPASVVVPGNGSVDVVVAVTIPPAEWKWVEHTLVVTATNSSLQTAVATLTTSTGGDWDGARYVGCRYDVNRSGFRDVFDVRQVWNGRAGHPPMYDYNFSGFVDVFDARAVWAHRADGTSNCAR